MAARKKAHVRAKAAEAHDDEPVDAVRIGQGVGTFETVNGMPQGIVTAVLVVIGVILIRPISRVLRAFLRR